MLSLWLVLAVGVGLFTGIGVAIVKYRGKCKSKCCNRDTENGDKSIGLPVSKSSKSALTKTPPTGTNISDNVRSRIQHNSGSVYDNRFVRDSKSTPTSFSKPLQISLATKYPHGHEPNEPETLTNQVVGYISKQCRLRERTGECGPHRDEMYQILSTLAADTSNDIEGRKSQVLRAINAEHAFRKCCARPIDWVTQMQERLGHYAFPYNPDHFNCRPAYYHTVGLENDGMQCIANGKFQSSNVFTKTELQMTYRLMPFCQMLDTYCRAKIHRGIKRVLPFRKNEHIWAVAASPGVQAQSIEDRQDDEVNRFQQCCLQYDDIFGRLLSQGCEIGPLGEANASGAFAREAETPHILSAIACRPES